MPPHVGIILEVVSFVPTELKGTKMGTDNQLAVSLATIEGRNSNAIDRLAMALNTLLANMFALYLKTKNFHWHVGGPNFRDYHLLLDAQANMVFEPPRPTRSLKGCARSARGPFDPSVTSQGCSDLPTMTRKWSRPRICCASCRMTTPLWSFT